MKELYICQHCPLGRNNNCHPNLYPESVLKDKDTNNIRIIPLKGKLRHENCRHFSCNLGIEQASRGMNLLEKGDGLEFDVNYIEEPSDVVTAIPFGTRNHKPKSMEGRIVAKNGSIFSYQDGSFYETGQKVEQDP